LIAAVCGFTAHAADKTILELALFHTRVLIDAP
jgi:hypothetical protein